MNEIKLSGSLEGRTVVVIGGTSGIGRAAAERAAENDAERITKIDDSV